MKMRAMDCLQVLIYASVLLQIDSIRGNGLLKDQQAALAGEAARITETVNSMQSNTWKAGRNHRFDELSLKSIQNQMGALHEDDLKKKDHLKIFHDRLEMVALPTNFDPREKWSNCSSMREIRDQGSCGSCWVSVEYSSRKLKSCHLQ